MRQLYKSLYLLLWLTTFSNCNAQETKGSPLSNDFDKFPPVYYGMPENISNVDSSYGWHESLDKLLLTGKVFLRDGRTPASNIILYYYHTNAEGKYVHFPKKEHSMPHNNLGQTHGYLRGWVKTDNEGKYSIYTSVPGSYPNRKEVAHIHVNIIEGGENQVYYIDDFVFDNDPLLTTKKRLAFENRGGSGILRLVAKNGVKVGERNIILGLNLPDDIINDSSKSSGRAQGEDVFSFTPYHLWGPDKGTKVCPMCKYGWYHGILYFVTKKSDWESMKKWLLFLEEISIQRNKHLKVYLVYGGYEGMDRLTISQKLSSLGQDLNLQKVALTMVPSFEDRESDVYLNRINPQYENTFLLYKRSIIIDKFIDLAPNASSFNRVKQALDESMNEYFLLPPIKNE